MKKYHGGIDTIVATVIMVVLVVLIIVMTVIDMTRESGQTINQAVTEVVEAQNNTQMTSATNGVMHFD